MRTFNPMKTEDRILDLKQVEHIVLIDDDETCNFVTKLVLRKAGFIGEVTCFNSAENALGFLVENEKEDKDQPDLIFVDINMPIMTGFEFLDAYNDRGFYLNQNTSVVMFSSSNFAHDILAAKEYTVVVDYVEKALTVENYKHILAKHHERIERTNKKQA